MYPSLGEHASYNDEERVPYSYQLGSNVMYQEEMEALQEQLHHNRNEHQVAAAAAVAFQQSQIEDDHPKPVKMFWHAYHIDTVQPLVPEQVRWFYKEDVKGTKWIPFIGYDSLRIECRYRALEHARSNNQDAEDVDTCIHVRGGLYEVDINNEVVHPVYWKDESLPILRGTWFFDGSWQPLEYEYSKEIEDNHLEKFSGQKIPDESKQAEKKVKLDVKHHKKFTDFHVDWYDVNETYMFSESAGSRAFRFFTTKIMSKSGTGTRLHRGYHEEAKMEDKPSDVSHLVFVVHGIGQKYNQNKIISCCNGLRNNSTKLIKEYFPDLIGSNYRIEFLPVEWRTDLQLDGDLVESITPEKLRNLRVILNSTAMDILYYTSPLYRGEIISGLNTELNRLYSMFCERHPYFEANNGQVSICAHSLGSVIMYDILTGWDPIELYDQYVSNIVREHSRSTVAQHEMTSSDRSKKLHDFYINSIIHKNESSLLFKVSNMFNLGSPLGVFLTLRGIRPKPSGRMNHLMPEALCRRFYNIYHPCDPVAYRIEPLVLRHYSTIQPLKIHRIHEQNKTPYSDMKTKAYAALNVTKTVKKKIKRKAQTVSKLAPSGGESLSGSSQTLSSIDDLSPRHVSPSSSNFPVPAPRRSLLRKFSQNDNHEDCKTMTTSETVVTTVVKTEVQSEIRLKQSDLLTVEPHDSVPGTLPTSSGAGITGAVKGFFSRFSRQNTAESKLSSEMNDLDSSEEEFTDIARLERNGETEQTELEYRLDYVLPGSSMSNSYVGAIFSHTSYWASPEVALFILSHVFPDYGPIK